MITAIGDKAPEHMKKQDLECMVPKQKDPSELKEESVPVQYLSRMLPGPSAQGLLLKTTIAKEVRAGLAYGASTTGFRFSTLILTSMVKRGPGRAPQEHSVFPFTILV